MSPAQPVDVGWYNVSWVDWLSVVGFALTLLGLFFAWRQAKRAATAAVAARAAAERSQRQFRANQLLVLVPQLRWISSELEAAIDEDNPRTSASVLRNWQSQAGHVSGILAAADEAEEELLKGIQSSIGLAFAATTALLDAPPDRTVLASCRKARQAIGNVVNTLTAWAAQASTSDSTETG